MNSLSDYIREKTLALKEELVNFPMVEIRWFLRDENESDDGEICYLSEVKVCVVFNEDAIDNSISAKLDLFKASASLGRCDVFRDDDNILTFLFLDYPKLSSKELSQCHDITYDEDYFVWVRIDKV